jgi:hypothetical protein
LFRNSAFNSKSRRAGHVFRVNVNERVQFYRWDGSDTHTFEL